MPIYRLTTAETILRQYVIEAPTRAAALEQWQPGTLYDSQPVPGWETIKHIEEDEPPILPPHRLDCPRCGRVMAMAQGGGFECRYHGCRNE